MYASKPKFRPKIGGWKVYPLWIPWIRTFSPWGRNWKFPPKSSEIVHRTDGFFPNKQYHSTALVTSKWNLCINKRYKYSQRKVGLTHDFGTTGAFPCSTFLDSTLVILLMVQKCGGHQLRLVVYPIIYKVLYISGGCLGFLNHQQYVHSSTGNEPRQAKTLAECQDPSIHCTPHPPPVVTNAVATAWKRPAV